MVEFIPVYRLSCYVPQESLELIKAAVSAIEGIEMGDYREVFWTSAPGTEQFRPTADAHPSSGRLGELNEVISVELVFCIPHSEALLQRVVLAIRGAHPWEEPMIYVDTSQICRPIARRAKN